MRSFCPALIAPIPNLYLSKKWESLNPFNETRMLAAITAMVAMCILFIKKPLSLVSNIAIFAHYILLYATTGICYNLPFSVVHIHTTAPTILWFFRLCFLSGLSCYRLQKKGSTGQLEFGFSRKERKRNTAHRKGIF
jgi:hypothetical protein